MWQEVQSMEGYNHCHGHDTRGRWEILYSSHIAKPIQKPEDKGTHKVTCKEVSIPGLSRVNKG